MLLKVFNAAGEAFPLVDVKDGRIEHLEDGRDRLLFRLDVRHPVYNIIAEETSIHYDDNAWLVKKIQDDAIECEIDFDFLKAEVKHGYKYQNQLLEKVLTDNLPAGWTIPSRCRSTTIAVSVRYRKKPCWEPSPVRFKPRMVCPLPSKRPQKIGIPSKSLPSRSRSAPRDTTKPEL